MSRCSPVSPGWSPAMANAVMPLARAPGVVLVCEYCRAGAGRVEGSLEDALRGLLLAAIDVAIEDTRDRLHGEPRVLVLVGELSAVIERRWAAREYHRSNGETAISPLVFHRKGRPVGDIRTAGGNACTAAGVGGTLFHDLRRSAVRNFEKAGVSQVVAMKISGHKTASIYCRYRIVDEADIADALTRTEVAFRDAPRAVVSSLRSASERQG